MLTTARLPFRSFPLIVLAFGGCLLACSGAETEDGVRGGGADDDVSEMDDDSGDGRADDDGRGDDYAPAGDDATDDDDGPPGQPEVVPIDAETADERLDERLEATLGGLADTVQAVEQSTTTSSESTDDMVSDISDCGGFDAIALDVTPAVEDLDEALRELGNTLQNDVFRDDLIESDDGTTVVYFMDPAIVCDGEDLECQQELTETEVRFAVSNLADDSMRIVAQIGEARDEPATMILADDRIVVSADLAELMDVLRAVGSDDDAEALPDTLSGVIEASIVKNANQNFTLNVGIVETLTLAQSVGDAGEQLVATIAAAPEAINAVIDGMANSVALALDVRSLDVSIPGSALCGDEDSGCGNKERNGTFHVHVDGLSAGTTLEDDAREIVISNIGLGDATSYARLNDDPLVEVDVNPEDGRRFGVQIQDTAEGALVTIEPKLDLAVATTLMNLSEAARVDLPEWLNDEIFAVTLGGNARGQILVPDGCAEAGHALEVREGTLTLDASSAAAPVVVEAGMCLAELETESDHPFDAIAAVMCE